MHVTKGVEGMKVEKNGNAWKTDEVKKVVKETFLFSFIVVQLLTRSPTSAVLRLLYFVIDLL